MIIDVHTLIWSSNDQLGPEIATALRSRLPDHTGLPEANGTTHEQAMTCVDVSLVLGFRADRLGARIPNEVVAAFVNGDSHKRLGICGIDPLSDDALDQLASGRDLGLVGATISPTCQGFHPAHSSAMRVYEQVVALNMPLLVASIEPLTRSAAIEFGRPALWDEVAQAFPNLPIVFGGLGYPWVDETLVMLAKHANMYADISGIVSRPWLLYNALLTATSLGVMNKLMFGSGFPFETPAKAIELLYSVNALAQGSRLPTIPRALLRGIVERDSLAYLGIEHDVAPKKDSRREDDFSIVEMLGNRAPMRTFRPD